MLLQIENVTKGFAGDAVLENINLQIQADDRIGLLGANGSGKTTLLNLIAGNLYPDSGHIGRKKGLQIGYLQQNDGLVGHLTIEQEAQNAFAKVHAVKSEMDAACLQMENDSENEALLERYDRLVAQFEALDGYQVDTKIDQVLTGLGFADFSRDTLVKTLSGGEKMRFAIARMLLREPELLMLDEPTNHLDFNMLGWLESYLQSYKGAILVVSHDRYFLDNVMQDTCEIERGKLTRYTGGYSSFVEQKELNRRTAMRAWQKQQVEIEAMEEFVRKNIARSASVSSVGSRVKALEKMKRLEKPLAPLKTISLTFDYDVEPYSTILTCEDLGVTVGRGEHKKRLYSHIDLTVQRGEKIAIVGDNGVGKSTFLKAIQEMVEHDGYVRWGGNVRIGYFDQELAGLPLDSTVLEAVHSQYPTKTELEIRSALGRMLIEGDDVYKKVRELSGANRAKVVFTLLLMKRANVLILDEPTNHLDYQAKEQLEQALNAFGGTLLVVSHDRYFLKKVPSRILEMHREGFVSYIGNYTDFLAEKEKQLEAQLAKEAAQKQKEESAAPQTGGNYRSREERARQAQHRNRLNAVESAIAQLETAIDAYNNELVDPANSDDFEKLHALSKALEEDTAALEEQMEEWLVLSEKSV